MPSCVRLSRCLRKPRCGFVRCGACWSEKEALRGVPKYRTRTSTADSSILNMKCIFTNAALTVIQRVCVHVLGTPYTTGEGV